MSLTDEVLNELEAIGAVGEKVVVLNLPKFERAVRAVPPATPEQPEDRQELSERLAVVHEVCGEALVRLEGLAKEVQDLQQVFRRLHEVTLLEPEGDRDAEVHQEA